MYCYHLELLKIEWCKKFEDSLPNLALQGTMAHPNVMLFFHSFLIGEDLYVSNRFLSY